MELFTVDYALNYEGWAYDKEVAPYNVYTLDQFTIRVRRNDFFLLLYITNECDELVFCGRIYTIQEYKEKIKKKLNKWKCRVYSTVDPTPNENLDIVPRIIDLTFTNGEIIDENVARIFNENVTQLNTTTLPSFNIRVGTDGFGNKLININAIPVDADVLVYTDTINFIGEDSGTLIKVIFNVTVLPSENVMLLESGDYILLENGIDKINLEL